jgi:hypothetical protein
VILNLGTRLGFRVASDVFLSRDQGRRGKGGKAKMTGRGGKVIPK